MESETGSVDGPLSSLLQLTLSWFSGFSMLLRIRTLVLLTVVSTLFSLCLLTPPPQPPLPPQPPPPQPTPPDTTLSIPALTRELEQTPIRYYVYNDNNVSLPEIRTRAIQNASWTWKEEGSGTRYADYARGEIRWLEALERHPLRTRNASEAALFVVPVPVGATLIYGTKDDLANAFRTILNSALFRRHPERHVAAISTTENVFGQKWWGLSSKEMELFEPTTIVRDSDRIKLFFWLRQHGRRWCGMNNIMSNHSVPRRFEEARNLGHVVPPGNADQPVKVEKWTKKIFDKMSNHFVPQRFEEAKYFSHVVSLGFGGEGSRPGNAYQPVTIESWTKKTFWFFYHSRKSPSTCNSTIFRHALFTKAAQFEHQPVTIGNDIPHEQWTREFVDSKFCLVIRGDSPGSRSLNRAIRAGCLPLIVSDSLPAFQPLYSKTLRYDDFALLVGEDDFLKDPVRSLDGAVSSLSLANLSSKVEGLRLMQRIMAADQPDSLFVPAFAREIVETMKEKPLRGKPFNRNHYSKIKRLTEEN